MAAAERSGSPVKSLNEQGLKDCLLRATRAADTAARSANKRLRRQQSQAVGHCAIPSGYVELIIVGDGAEIPALARLGLIAPAGQGLWRLLAPCRFGGVNQPLAVALASAGAAAQVLSGHLPHLCISTRSFAITSAAAACGEVFSEASARPAPL